MKRTTIGYLVLLLVWLAACGGAREPASVRGQDVPGSPGPGLAVERFLQAANTNDLVTMMQLFGTAERTIDQLDGRSQAERRMYVLASLQRHDDYSILGQRPVPGRLNEAVEVQVRLHRRDDSVVVPYTVVRRESGGWIIEKVDVEPLTKAR
ncbi:MAG: hypothetical protein ACLFRX_01270 [Gemmatimonadota bacterium]